MRPGCRRLEVIVHREGQGAQRIVTCVVDPLEGYLEARRRRILVIAICQPREEDRGEGQG